jgi:hypothetical protein
MTMNLFDTDDRSDTQYMKQSQSIYSFLNQSAWPEKEQTRILLEHWFHEYPAGQSKDVGDLYSRFRSEDDLQHCAAFFELYCSALFRHHDFSLKTHQPANPSTERCPDFLVYSSNMALFHLEVTVVSGEEIDLRNQMHLNDLADALNSIDSPHFLLHLSVTQVPSTSPSALSVGKIRKFTQNALRRLDYAEVAEQLKMQHHCSSLSLRPWIEGEWKVYLSFSPRSPERVKHPGYRSLSTQSFPAQWTSDVERSQRERLSKNLKDKTYYYGIFDHPYIVAVNTLNPMSEGDLHAVLFGDDRLWFDEKGRSQRVSAVLFVSGLGYWNIARTTPVLWHNPWADYPLDKKLWQGPQVVFDKKSMKMQLIGGKDIRELLQLSPDWPNGMRTEQANP